MAENSNIEWTDHTFNSHHGCSKVSAGCANCYAEALTERFGGDFSKRKRTSAANWKLPLKWNRAGRLCVECGTPIRADGTAIDCKCGQFGAIGKTRRPRVFCNSMSDWLDDQVPIEWLADLLKLIHDTPNLDWLLLTKRPENFFQRMNETIAWMPEEWDGDDCPAWVWWMQKWFIEGDPPANIFPGASVENQPMADKRIPELRKIPAKMRFLSVEPMLSEIKLHLTRRIDWAVAGGPDECAHGYAAGIPCQKCKPNVDWVICGGESGRKKRPFDCEWARGLRDQCKDAGVAFFMKQVDKVQPISEDLMIREFPRTEERKGAYR